MDTDREETPEEEEAFFDYMNAREACLVAAVGSFVTDNVPTSRLRIIDAFTTNETIALAARIAIEHRREGGQV